MNKEEMEYVEKLLPEVNEIKDLKLREKVIKAWIVAWHRGSYKRIEDAMYSFGNVTLCQHTRVVTRICMASADVLRELHGLQFKRDYLIAAALLHDIDKYITVIVDKNGNHIRNTKFPHGYIQAKIVQDLDMPDEIAHAVLVHSRRRYTINRPETLEAIVLQDADILAMNPLILHDGENLHY